MIPPGWNVTEPLHIAKKLYDYIQALRGASDEVKSFASKLRTFCIALEELEKCLANLTTASADDTKHLRDTLDGCWNCAMKCRDFIDQFKELNEPIQGKINAGGKLNWVWKKDTAARLRLEINSQIDDINLLLGIASLYVILMGLKGRIPEMSSSRGTGGIVLDSRVLISRHRDRPRWSTTFPCHRSKTRPAKSPLLRQSC